MSEVFEPNLAARNMLPAVDSGEIKKTIAQVQVLDPELLEHADTRLLVELGARLGKEVTRRYGTPLLPKWASGSHETCVVMTYHNGGEDGHTSIGRQGSGVPRNVLLIASAVNKAAGREVYDPLMRATAFFAAEAHDSYQLCGRILLPEGQGEGRGDERLSAEYARGVYLAAGGTPKTAQHAYDNVMATAFNPKTSAQNVSYEAWYANPTDPVITGAVLGCELTAAADLLGSTGPRGPLNSVEYSIESLCLAQNSQIMQEQLHAQGIDPARITTIGHVLDLIAPHAPLRDAFADAVARNAAFTADHLQYSDQAIRAACGMGIDNLFPGRAQNAVTIARYAQALGAGAHPRVIWEHARGMAGY